MWPIRSRRPSRSSPVGRRPPGRAGDGGRRAAAPDAPGRGAHLVGADAVGVSRALGGLRSPCGRTVPAGQRDRLERFCRYALRPPLADDRLHLTGTGDVALEFRRPWSDGTTHLVFAPVAFLARLAVLYPARA